MSDSLMIPPQKVSKVRADVGWLQPENKEQSRTTKQLLEVMGQFYVLQIKYVTAMMDRHATTILCRNWRSSLNPGN